MADPFREFLEDFEPKADEPLPKAPPPTLKELAEQANARKTAVVIAPPARVPTPPDPFYVNLNLDALVGSPPPPVAAAAVAAAGSTQTLVVAPAPRQVPAVDDDSSSGGEAEDTGAGVSFRRPKAKHDIPPPPTVVPIGPKRNWNSIAFVAILMGLHAVVAAALSHHIYQAWQVDQAFAKEAVVRGGVCIRDSDHPMANCKAAATHYGKLVLPFTSWAEHNFTQAGQHRWLSARQVGQMYCMICDVESLLVTEANLAAKQVVNSTCYCAPSLVQVERAWRVESTNNQPHTLPIAQFAGAARAMCRLEAAETYESCLERADAVLFKEQVHVNKIAPPL